MADHFHKLGVKSSLDKKRLLRLALERKGVTSKSSSQNNHITPRESNNLLALSSAQQRLWFLEQFTNDTVAYVFCNKVDLRGRVDLDAVKKSYQTIVNRHEIFRTCYRQQNGIAYQAIEDNVEIDIPLIDLSNLSRDDQQTQLAEIVENESRRPFNLEEVPLMRMCIVRLELEHHVVLQTVHHIVYDGWSLAVMYRELKVLYEAYIQNKPDPLPPLDIQYADFANWQNKHLESSEMRKQLAFWKQNLAGHLPVLELPTDSIRPAVQSYAGALHKFKFSKQFSESLRLFSISNESTLSMVMLAAFKILLHRYTSETDIIVGMPIANRNHHQIEKLVGFFVNSLVLKTSLDFDPSVIELISRVRSASSQAYENQDLPFERIVDEVQPARDIGHHPVFQVMFAFQNTPELPDSIGDAKMDLEVLDNGTSVFDVTLNLHDENEEIYGYFEYCTDIFNESTIERMLGHYKTLLEGMLANPKNRISQLQLLTNQEYQQLVFDWNSTSVSYDSNRCVHHLIEGQVDVNPSAIAVSHIDQMLSYQDLNSRANQLAHYLQSKGLIVDTIVAVYMDRSCEMFVAILAILKAGGAYLPLDPSYPSDRIAFMLEDSGAGIVLTHKQTSRSLPDQNLDIIRIDHDESTWRDQSVANPVAEVDPGHLAYIIYTSGSTGKPKGVMVRHRNLVHSTLARIHYYQQPLKKYLLLSSFAFDSSVAGIFWAFCQGGELRLPEQDMEKDILQVAELLHETKATHMLSLPSIYSLLLSVATPKQLSSLNTVIVAGEACPIELVAQHESELPGASLYNEYGPTEGTVWSTVYQLSNDSKVRQVPIGKPVPNVRTYVLDKKLHPVPIGVLGELFIGGAGVVRGYLNRKELTAERFICNPVRNNSEDILYRTGDLAKYQTDGNILFCGRTDHQVKIRGYRIELGEIESTLSSFNSISDAVVVARESTGQNSDTVKSRMLVAYVVANEKLKPATDELKSWLRGTLPEYMVPQIFVFIDKIPLSPNGKVDMKALPEPGQDQPLSSASYVKADNPIEESLIKVWGSVLAADLIGIHDNFFEIGGDSILSIQIIARARALGIHLTPKQIFQNPTIFELARVAESKQSITAEQGLVTGELLLTPVQRWLLERDLPNPDHWNQAVMLRVPRDLNLDHVKKVFELLASQHDVFRAHFIKLNNQWRQDISESFCMDAISTKDLSGLPYDEQATALNENASQIQATLDITHGKLIAAGYFEMGGGNEENNLFIAVHHLVIDVVSWTPFLEDFETLYAQIKSDQPVVLPDKTTSFMDWAKIISDYSTSNKLKNELDYWLSLPDSDVFDIPTDHKFQENLESAEHKYTVALSVVETQDLLSRVPAAYNTRIDDILLTAMAETINCWSEKDTLALCLEGHGREPIDDSVDLSRTIGWFTTHFPVTLKLDNFKPETAIKSIKEQLRKTPDYGIGYGILRYFSTDEKVTEQLKSIHQANILYNYLGQINSQTQGDMIFRPSYDNCGNDHDPAGPRTHLLEINAMVINDQLKVEWLYNIEIHQHQTIKKLAENYLKALQKLITHCLLPESGGFTASDFPLANLNQEDLEELLCLLED